jgi:nitrogen fixation protein NifB
MNMMRHCRQCRADAVGLLGEDRGAEFTIENVEAMEIDYAAAMEKRQRVHTAIAETLVAQTVTASLSSLPSDSGPIPDHAPNVLVAVASKGGGLVNQHFGHAQEFLIYEASPNGVRLLGHRKTGSYCAGTAQCGEAEEWLNKTIETLADCDAVLCSRVGHGPWDTLEKAGIEPSGQFAMIGIEEAVQRMYEQMYHAGKLSKNNQQATA